MGLDKDYIESIKPIGDKLLLKMRPHQISNHVIAPARFRPDVCRWEVLAVGSGKLRKGKRLPLDLEVGETVLLSGRFLADRRGLEVTLLHDPDNNQPYMIASEDHVLCAEQEIQEQECEDDG